MSRFISTSNNRCKRLGTINGRSFHPTRPEPDHLGEQIKLYGELAKLQRSLARAYPGSGKSFIIECGLKSVHARLEQISGPSPVYSEICRLEREIAAVGPEDPNLFQFEYALICAHDKVLAAQRDALAFPSFDNNPEVLDESIEDFGHVRASTPLPYHDIDFTWTVESTQNAEIPVIDLCSSGSEKEISVIDLCSSDSDINVSADESTNSLAAEAFSHLLQEAVYDVVGVNIEAEKQTQEVEAQVAQEVAQEAEEEMVLEKTQAVEEPIAAEEPIDLRLYESFEKIMYLWDY